MTLPIPISVTKAPRPLEESNLRRERWQLERVPYIDEGESTHCSPLFPGLEVSFRKPVYSMVTLSPTVGMAPWPCARMVFVTPMIAEVREKFRVVVDVERGLESRVVRVRIDVGRKDMEKERSKGIGWKEGQKLALNLLEGMGWDGWAMEGGGVVRGLTDVSKHVKRKKEAPHFLSTPPRQDSPLRLPVK